MRRLAGFVVVFAMTATAFAQEGGEEDFLPGLKATIGKGAGAVTVVVPDVEFAWGAGSPLDRVPADDFEAAFSGMLLVKEEVPHTFHLFLQGEATVRLDGKEVVGGQRETPGWVSGKATAVEFGERKLEVVFRKTAREAQVRLFWSSEKFPIEPVPAQLFFHEGGGGTAELKRIDRGRELYDALRCNRCHRRENEREAPTGPALTDIRGGLFEDWLAEWLQAPQKVQAQARMPGFGFSANEAKAVAAFLSVNAKERKSSDVPLEDREKAAREGEVLFRSVGCLACHTHGGQGTDSPYNGGDLTNIGRKRPVGWLSRWLKEPDELNADHRMPVFKLKDDERQALAAFLAGPEGDGRRRLNSEKSSDRALVDAGRKLIDGARCAVCHRLGEIVADVSKIPTLEKRVGDWAKSCVGTAGDRSKGRPAYGLSEEDQTAIRAFVESKQGALVPESQFTLGARQLRQKNCLSCHERDGGKGIVPIAGKMAQLDPDLRGLSDAMIPPDLTAVGDKLTDAALSEAIGGEQKTFRLPWLQVRMPRFQHSPEEKAVLLAYFIGHDRIPEGAPSQDAAVATVSDSSKHSAELRTAGQALAGARGFSCVACHKVGKLEPRNVALATRGSDLYLLVDRMRPEFFPRWVRSPLRIVPNMEMPSFEKPSPGILGGRLDEQLAAMWVALNDRKGPPALDTSTVEQLLVVRAGEPAKIIRDVFNIGDATKPEFVARAFAIGFDNGHNVLFDLDTMSLKAWWTGDFARQRASGKSWYWEPAGMAVEPGSRESRILLYPEEKPDSDGVLPRSINGRISKLLGYERSGAGVTIRYRLEYEIQRRQVPVEVVETFEPRRTGEKSMNSGWVRRMELRGVPRGYIPVAEHKRSSAEKVYEHVMPLETNGGTGIAKGSYALVADGISSPPTPSSTRPPVTPIEIEKITTVPGYDGVRLPLDRSIMPTAIAWTADGTLAFCSLKGQVYLAKDSDEDGIPDQLTIFEEGSSAPYGLIADGKDLIVAHKPELLRLRDTDGDGRADLREVIADGWGFTDDYHDWTTGIIRDSKGNLYVGTGSDYAKKGRSADEGRLRGKVLRIDPQGHITPMGHAFRYPTGLAITLDDQIFVSDNQGVQNTFNEINHLVEGAWYGVPSNFEEKHNDPPRNPAIRLPHPWTRSVNGVFFLPAADVRGLPVGQTSPPNPFSGHGIGCEYDTRFLVRFTLQRVGDTFQGAVYPFSLPEAKDPREGFLGTLCGAVAPNGDIYIGSIHDSGWLGGPNVGDIVRLRPNGQTPLGIRELRAYDGEFFLTFTKPVDKAAAAKPENYDITGYTRVWQGAYATPDSNRHKLAVKSVDVAENGLSVTLHVERPQENHVYEVNVGKIGPNASFALWPAVGHYTMNAIPKSK